MKPRAVAQMLDEFQSTSQAPPAFPSSTALEEAKEMMLLHQPNCRRRHWQLFHQVLHSVCVYILSYRTAVIEAELNSSCKLLMPTARTTPWHGGRSTQQHSPGFSLLENITCVFLPPAHPQEWLLAQLAILCPATGQL